MTCFLPPLLGLGPARAGSLALSPGPSAAKTRPPRGHHHATKPRYRHGVPVYFCLLFPGPVFVTGIHEFSCEGGGKKTPCVAQGKTPAYSHVARDQDTWQPRATKKTRPGTCMHTNDRRQHTVSKKQSLLWERSFSRVWRPAIFPRVSNRPMPFPPPHRHRNRPAFGTSSLTGKYAPTCEGGGAEGKYVGLHVCCSWR